MSDRVNYYEVLGVSRNASQEEIHEAYRRLAKERHPDRGGSPEEFSLLQEAHEVLSDPERRRRHDEELDLAYAADQLSELDFSRLEDELAARREERERSGPSLGERLRGRLRRKEPRVRRQGRYVVREARWYEPHRFDPEPATWKSGTITFVLAFLAFIAAGQLGLWAEGIGRGSFTWTAALGPYMPVVYALVGLIASYLAFRSAGYIAVALVFIAALVVGQSGGPQGLLQFATLGIVVFLLWIYAGSRRERSRR
ncbi:MAG: J domain-containing protein [Rubrobacteraceae bacterium]|nr:J domain-containing protein [Rubrobacteraceae bacterium]